MDSLPGSGGAVSEVRGVEWHSVDAEQRAEEFVVFMLVDFFPLVVS